MKELTSKERQTLGTINALRESKEPRLRKLGGRIAYAWRNKNERKAKWLEQYKDFEQITEAMWLEVLTYIEGRFYTIPTMSSGEALYQHNAGREDQISSLKVARNTIVSKFEGKVPSVLLEYLGEAVPACAAYEYRPGEEVIFEDDHTLYANTYVRPLVQPTAKPRKLGKVEDRPPRWQEYLDRLMPRENLCWMPGEEGNLWEMPQQDYFEMWIAQRVRYPHVQNTVGVVLRGGQGTGKGVWQDVLLSRLIGPSNYKPCDIKDVTGAFNEDIYQCVVLHIEEVRNTRLSTGDILKKLITQQKARVNAKGIQQRYSDKYLSVVISSNYRTPTPVEQDDRRLFIPVFSQKKPGSEAFFKDFVDWVTEGDGAQVMRDWFERVYLPDGGKGFRTAPMTEDKRAVMLQGDRFEDKISEMVAWLNTFRGQVMGKHTAFTRGAVQERWRVTDSEAQTALKDAGFVAVKRRIVSGAAPLNIWVPAEDKDNRAVSWHLWHNDSERSDLSLPQEPESPESNPF